MCRVTILRCWDDGSALRIEVKGESSYPDAMHEAARTAVDTFTEALAVTCAGDE